MYRALANTSHKVENTTSAYISVWHMRMMDEQSNHIQVLNFNLNARKLYLYKTPLIVGEIPMY